MTRFQTYQMPYGFITINTTTEQPPEEFIAGPFMVNVAEAQMIQDGAEIEVTEDGNSVNVYHPVEVL